MGRGAILLICVLVPLAGAFLLPLPGRISTRLRNYCALGISFTLTADALAVFMAVVSSLVGALIMLFSFDYISHYENQNEYYLMAVLFLGSMMGLVFSANLIFLYPARAGTIESGIPCRHLSGLH